MATGNTKRIEETATTVLKSALLRCPILESYIDSNDKTPSWDGTVFVYNSEDHEKGNFIGRVPIQVKGTETFFEYDTASFSCNVNDLKNYYKDGGCIFFLISVEPDTGKYKIFYSSLLVVDLDKILKKANTQKTYTIRLMKFPEAASSEMAHIFLSFVNNSPKQMSFIGKDILSIEDLKKKGMKIESLSFNTSGIGLNKEDLPSFISSHDFYLYVKPEGLDIDIPVDRVSGATVSKQVNAAVKVKERIHYSSYSVVYKKGKPTVRIGKCFSLVLYEKKSSISFKPTGTLSDLITDTSFFVDFFEQREVSLNGAIISFKESEVPDLDGYKSSLAYYKDVKKMLDLLGVTEELEYINLTQQDKENINNFISAILYNHKIRFPGVEENTFYGPLKIANISIYIWATEHENGLYSIENFFNVHPLVMFTEDDIEQKKPISVSQFLLLDKSAFAHTSNMNYKIVYEDLTKKELTPELLDRITILLLNMLSGYDEQEKKNTSLLDLAENLCNWIASHEIADTEITILNKIQIVKRRRKLNVFEIAKIAKLTDDAYPPNIKCGAYILLDDNIAAQKNFDELPPSEQEEFLTYPICALGDLKI